MRTSRSKRSPATLASAPGPPVRTSSGPSAKSEKSSKAGELARPRGTKMKTHFSEADLLETYYLQPGESMPVMMHLAVCDECAAKYERLERKLREAAACP